MKSVVISIALAVAWALPNAAQAQMNNGQAIAEQWCANCHGSPSRTAAVASDAAPPFSHLAKLGPDRIRGVLTAPHEQMRGIDLTREQMDQVIDYIVGLETAQ